LHALAPSPAPRASILLVDDHPGNLLALEAVLEPLNQRLVRACSGEEALRCLLDEPFAVILLDVQMPGLDGFQTAELIKKRERTRHIPIVFLTAIAREEANILAGYTAGAVDYLVKPFEPQILRTKVAVFIDLYLEAHRHRADEPRAAQQLQVITDTLPALVAYIDAEERYRFCNVAYRDWFGNVPEAILGRTVRERLGEDGYAVAGPFIRRALAGEAVRYDLPLQTRAGAPLHLEPHFIPDIDAQGRVRGFVSLAIDVTARKQAEDRTSQLQSAAASLSRALTPEDVARRVLDQAMAWMEATAGAVYLQQPEGILRSIYDVGYPESYVAPMRECRESDELPASDAFRSREPRFFTSGDAVAARYVPLTERRTASGLGAAAALPLLVDERAIGTLVLSFNAARTLSREDRGVLVALAQLCAQALERARLFRDAEEAVRLRDEFLSIASHELKTPLTPLQLKLQGLRREAGLERHFETAEDQVRKLSTLINSLLDVSRLSSGQLRLQQEDGVDLAALVSDVVALIAPQAAKAGVTLALEIRAPVVGRFDRMRVEQVVHNLLSNALKYGAGHPVTVRVESRGALGVLSIRDQGIGIPPDALGRIFGKFERAVSERHYGGLGLGLYITRQLVEAMGGTVQAESVVDRGSTFRVELPRV